MEHVHRGIAIDSKFQPQVAELGSLGYALDAILIHEQA